MDAASKARTAEVRCLEREKKEIGAQLELLKKVWAARTKALKKLRQKGMVGIHQLRLVWRRSWQSQRSTKSLSLRQPEW
jgi:hypothetical protein